MSVIILSPEEVRVLIGSAVQEAIAKAIAQLPAAVADEIGGIKLAAEVTGFSPSTIYKMVERREIPYSKRANRLFFRKSELMDWAMSGERPVK